MNKQLLKVYNPKLSEVLLPILIGQVFHVTTPSAYQSISNDEVIKHNKNGDFPFTFGQSNNSYFRKRGCVSVFDLRSATLMQIYEVFDKYNFLNPSFAANKPVFLLLKPAAFELLIPWSTSADEKIFDEMVIPHVEAGFPGNIQFSLVAKAILVEIE